MDKDHEARMSREHFEKYEALARAFESFDLPSYVPPTVERIKAALAAGDEHLNSIPLATWDRAAQVWDVMPSADRWMYGETRECPTCHGRTLRVLPDARPLWGFFHYPLANGRRAYYSAAERVCLLKHVARFWMAGAEPPPQA